jgi:hypothetical protein
MILAANSFSSSRSLSTSARPAELAFCGHRGEERLGANALLGCQTEFGRELEHVGGTCESIELGGLGQAHAFAREQRTDLFRRECLDVAGFLANVRR